MEPAEPTALIEFLQPYAGEVIDLALAARNLLLEMLWPVNEVHYDANSAVCSGFTYTHSVNDCFANFAVYADHVTLVFGYGVHLSDSERRLKGSGNRVRHIRLEGLRTLMDPYILALIRQASEQAPRPTEPFEPSVIVKIMRGKKRRPFPRRNP